MTPTGPLGETKLGLSLAAKKARNGRPLEGPLHKSRDVHIDHSRKRLS